MNQTKVSEIVKNIRKNNNLTQKQLGDILGVTYQAVSKWENGKNIPDITMLKIISEKFNINIEELLTGKKKADNNKTKRIVIFFVLFIINVSIFSIIYFNKNPYEFKNLKSNNLDFEVKGVIAFSNKKSSIYISNVKTNLEDNTQYQELECTLYELSGNKHTMISKCEDISSNQACKGATLSELLSNVSFNVSDFSSSCKHFEHNSLYLEINVLDKNNKNFNYKVPLILEKSCNIDLNN